MTIGFLLALAAGLIWSVNNVIDKVVLHKLIRSPLFQLFIFTMTSLLLGIAAIPFTDKIIYGSDWGLVIAVSTCFVIGTLCYFKALQHEEPSRVVPLFSLTIVFIAILGAFFLGEVFSLDKYFGMACIAIGSFIISSKIRSLDVFRSKSVGLMVLSSLVYSCGWVLIKYLLDTYSYWEVFAYQRIFIGVIGFLIVLVFFPQVKNIYNKAKAKYVAISFSTEVIGVTGALLFTAAMSYWYVTLVETVASVQYLFIFAWGIIVSRFQPRLFTEEVNKRAVMQKIISIVLIIFGVYLIA